MRPLFVISVLFLAGCSRSNNLLLGRVENTVGGHTVVVTDCYQTSVPAPEKVEEGVYRFAPCRDAEVVIRRGELVVNGRSYGKLLTTDSVLVDHGVVKVNGKE